MIDPYIGAEQPGKAWPHLFFIAFLESMAAGLGPGQTADFRKKFETFRDRPGRTTAPRRSARDRWRLS